MRGLVLQTWVVVQQCDPVFTGGLHFLNKADQARGICGIGEGMVVRQQHKMVLYFRAILFKKTVDLVKEFVCGLLQLEFAVIAPFPIPAHELEAGVGKGIGGRFSSFVIVAVNFREPPDIAAGGPGDVVGKMKTVRVPPEVFHYGIRVVVIQFIFVPEAMGKTVVTK